MDDLWLTLLAMLALLVWFSLNAQAQGLPDAPQKSTWRAMPEYVPPTPRSWNETFHPGKLFWTTHGVFALSIVGDELITMRGERHGCFEQGNPPSKVSIGRLALVDWTTFVGIMGIDFLMRKVRIPIAPVTTPLVAVAKHSLGMANWAETSCL